MRQAMPGSGTQSPASPPAARGCRAAQNRHELASPHGRPFSGLGPHTSTPLLKNVAVHHSKNCALMSQMCPVTPDVAHLMRDNQMVFGIDGDLNIVADDT